MHRQTILAFIVVAAGIGSLLATTAQSQVGPPKQFVALQPTTPGTSQSGHVNVNGTIRASQLVGGGTGVSGVNADLFDGLNSTAFLQSVPVPLRLDATIPSGPVVDSVNNSFVSFSSALRGETFGGFTFGVHGVTRSGVGVRGESVETSGIGVSAESLGLGLKVFGGNGGIDARSSNGNAIFAESNNQNAIHAVSHGVATHGVFGAVSHPNANGAGVYGSSSSAMGIGVRATSAGTGLYVTGTNRGIEAHSTFGPGIRAESAGASGVEGIANGPNGNGVFGEVGNGNSIGAGVYGLARESTGSNYAVVGNSLDGAGSYGVFSFGHFGATGTKAFRIDHPFDPLNKYLLHYCAEGPEPMNVYSGTVVTGEDGCAIVELPDYFSEINRDPRVHITADDESEDFVLCKVVGGVKGNAFRIRTSKPTVKVYWRVEAVRNDRWVEKHGAPVEMEKPAHERGQYQHPELYGLPAKQFPAPKSKAPKGS